MTEEDIVAVEGVEEGSEQEIKADSSHTEMVELTEEELDRVADTAIDALQGILKHFDVGEVTIDEYEGDEGELILDITGDNLAILIGRHGKTLDALQFIISAITTRTLGSAIPSWLTWKAIKTASARSSSPSRARRRIVRRLSIVASSSVR